MKLSFKEVLTFKVLSHLKHDGEKIAECKFNDFLFWIAFNVINPDMDTVGRIILESYTRSKQES